MTARRPVAGAGFGGLVRAEWTKLRSVPSSLWSLLAAMGLIVLFAVMISMGNPGTYSDAQFVDRFRFAHRTLAGDGSIVVRVRDQQADHPWAMAGVMVKQSATAGAPYAAIAITPGHGVRFQARFTTDIAGSAHRAPRWLKLSRAGATVTGYESADGATWHRVGEVRLPGLPPVTEIGLFATAPGGERAVPMRPVLLKTGPAKATFDNISVTATTSQQWRVDDVGRENSPQQPAIAQQPDDGGALTLAGLSGDILGQTDDGSRIIAAVAGSVAGLVPLLALGVSFIASEYQHGLIRTTFTAGPRRGRVLAAKAVVLGGVTFAAMLTAIVAAFLVSQPLLRRHGFSPPTYPDPSLADPAVLRVLAGTAAFLSLMTVFALGVGAVLRRGAAAVPIAVTVALMPMVITPLSGSPWPQRLAPLAGLSIQQVKETDDAFLLPWAGRPWTGPALLAVYVAATLAAGLLLMRRRDV
ncbi:ABC transporter permease subunit [Actinomadura macra]|uniref:ABC transporter permease subunit n=1 Tax=Actinomadura macra TaxID=46164 RepID=UPI00083335D3|nr:ABC transporter permease subunit [Actinomadura macra]